MNEMIPVKELRAHRAAKPDGNLWMKKHKIEICFRWHLQWNFNWINAFYSHQYGRDYIFSFHTYSYVYKKLFKHQWNHWNFRSHEYTFTHTVTHEKIISPIHPPTFSSLLQSSLRSFCFFPFHEFSSDSKLSQLEENDNFPFFSF